MDVWKGRYTALGYRSARVATKEGRVYSVVSGDTDLEYDRLNLIAQSRTFWKDNAIYRGMIGRAIGDIVGSGFKLQVKSDDPDYNAKLEGLWNQWDKRPEVRQLLGGGSTACMVCRELMVSGDTGAILTSLGLVQLIESEQITDGTRQSLGIKLDETGRPVSFNVCPYGPGGMITKSKGRAYSPESFIFLTDPSRPSQTRGEPALQSAFAMLHRINDVCDSEAIAWQMLSRIALSVTQEKGASLGYATSKADASITDTEGKLSTRLTEMGYALIFHGRPGEKVEGITRNLPSSNFTESLRTFLRLLGLPIGLPLELILLDWTQGNYSQSRAVLEQAYQAFTSWQTLIENFFYAPLLAWKMREWQGKGLIAENADAPINWIRPTFPWIDQLKEVQAYGAKVDRGFTTHSAVCKSLNGDRDDIVSARDLEVRDAIKRAQAIKKDTGIEVPWQIFCGMEAPKATAPAAQADQASSTADQQNQDGGQNQDGNPNE
jgi:capsid protein